MLIDCHMHYFPDQLAAKTMQKLSAVWGSAPHGDGTFRGTLLFMEHGGIDRGIALPIATTPRSQRNVNDYALETQAQSGGKLISFGSVHPFAPDAVEELRRVAKMGLHGIKLHADYQGFYFQDSRCYPIYEETSALGLPLTIHAGFDPLSPSDIHATAAAVVQVARDFPRLRIIAAHMGGLGYGAAPEPRLFDLPNVWFDTAVAPACYQECAALFAEHLRRRGAERVLFGTDCPWETPDNIQRFLQRCGLSAAELDRIYYQNALELFPALQECPRPNEKEVSHD